MVFGLFSTAEQKAKARNLRLFDLAKTAYESKRLMFRDNAISKLSFINPDMKFIFNTQCDIFAGVDPANETFVLGQFDDRSLPSLRELEDSQKYSDFPELCKTFMFLLDDHFLTEAGARKARAGEVGFSYYEGHFVYELRVSKNGQIIARSNNPKRAGYFRNLLYRSVVQDIKGTGRSELRVSIYFSNYAESFIEDVFFHYQDPPRKAESQLRDHYISVCSLFLPFLEAGEIQLRSASFANGGKFDVTNWDTGDDTDILGSTINKTC
jgi:hypothetical protein